MRRIHKIGLNTKIFLMRKSDIVWRGCRIGCDIYRLYFVPNSDLEILSRARFLPIIGTDLQIVQILVLDDICFLTRSLQSSQITCPTYNRIALELAPESYMYIDRKLTLHCHILEGGAITSMHIGHSSSFLAESTINGTSPVYNRKLVRMRNK